MINTPSKHVQNLTNYSLNTKKVRLFNYQKILAPKNIEYIKKTIAGNTKKNVCLEIGAGCGMHALQFAKNNPNKTLYAIERTKSKFLSLQKRLQNIKNAHAIHACAIATSAYAFKPKQLSECFILYPNPEPKNKNQRFINMPFFEFLLSRLQNNGRITLATNIKAYADEVCDLAKNIYHIPCTMRTITQNTHHVARTHFEAKYLMRGQICYDIILTKPNNYITRFDDIMRL